MCVYIYTEMIFLLCSFCLCSLNIWLLGNNCVPTFSRERHKYFELIVSCKKMDCKLDMWPLTYCMTTGIVYVSISQQHAVLAQVMAEMD